MIEFKELIGKNIEIEISGGYFHEGVLVDSGLDILVLFVGKTGEFLYIPVGHIQRLKETKLEENTSYYEQPSEKPIDTEKSFISFREILTTARGRFVEVYVAGNKSIYGYIRSIMNDHFVCYSPVYKTMFVSMNHLKWLIPLPENCAPYSLNNQTFSVIEAKIPLARSFADQCKKLENQMVIIDGGDNNEKIGLLQQVRNNKLTLITAEGDVIFRNLEHVKTIQPA